MLRDEPVTNENFVLWIYVTHCTVEADMIEKLKQFLADVSKEMKKVSWPTKEQLQESTVVVLSVCFIITVIVFGIDAAMTKIVELIF